MLFFYTRKKQDYSEYLHLKVITSGISPQIVAQRLAPVYNPFIPLFSRY